MDMSAEMGIELLTEEVYRYLQALKKFDAKTSIWFRTPDAIRKLGRVIFNDLHYGHVFIYLKGAQPYYVSRAFR